MYSVPLPISVIRTRIRQEFERNRFVNKLNVVDVLLTKGHADYQVRLHFIVTIHMEHESGDPQERAQQWGPCPKSGEPPNGEKGDGFQTRGPRRGISKRRRMLCAVGDYGVVVMIP